VDLEPTQTIQHDFTAKSLMTSAKSFFPKQITVTGSGV
jgi:hypothetical protein